MCLIVFSYNQHPKYPLIFAANRDESYERPTQSADFWDQYPNILAGKDLEAGGTWLGINKAGKFSAITNYRDPSIKKETPPSRGHLVLDFLNSNSDPSEYAELVHRKADKYMGFNLLVGNLDQLVYYSNQQKKIQPLDSGLYGLSNHLLETPWPKVRRSRQQLRDLINNEAITPNSLFDLLADDRQAPDNQLPDTGIPTNIEKKVSAIFIKGDNYGTRNSTILLIDRQNQVTFVERRFKSGTMEVDEENRYEFLISQ